MTKEKKKALLIIGAAGAVSLIFSVCCGIIVFTFFPLLVTFLLILVGMACKWAVEWCVKNRHIFKIRERSKKVKEKLKIDEGIKAVKDSYEVLRKDRHESSRNDKKEF
jgi:hypothetical protein